MHEAIRIVVVYLVGGGATVGFVTLTRRLGWLSLTGKHWIRAAFFAWPVVMVWGVPYILAKQNAYLEFVAEAMVPPLLEWRPFPWPEPPGNRMEARFRELVARTGRTGKAHGVAGYALARLLQLAFEREPDPAKLSWHIDGAGKKVTVRSSAGLVAREIPRWVAEQLLMHAAERYKRAQS